MKNFILETIAAKEKMDGVLLSIAECIISTRQDEGIHDHEINVEARYTHHSVSVMVGDSFVYSTIVETEDFEDYENVIHLNFPIEYLDMTLEEIQAEEKILAKVESDHREQREIKEAMSVIDNAGGRIIWSVE